MPGEGDTAPDFTLSDQDSNPVTLSGLRGTTVVLYFTLLADPEHEVAAAYGTWVEKRMYGKTYWGVQRATFIVDAEGKIARAFPKVSPKSHDDLILGALDELAAA